MLWLSGEMQNAILNGRRCHPVLQWVSQTCIRGAFSFRGLSDGLRALPSGSQSTLGIVFPNCKGYKNDVLINCKFKLCLKKNNVSDSAVEELSGLYVLAL